MTRGQIHDKFFELAFCEGGDDSITENGFNTNTFANVMIKYVKDSDLENPGSCIPDNDKWKLDIPDYTSSPEVLKEYQFLKFYCKIRDEIFERANEKRKRSYRLLISISDDREGIGSIYEIEIDKDAYTDPESGEIQANYEEGEGYYFEDIYEQHWPVLDWRFFEHCVTNDRLKKLSENIKGILENDSAEEYNIVIYHSGGGEPRKFIFGSIKEYPKIKEKMNLEDLTGLDFEFIWICEDYGHKYCIPLEYVDEYLLEIATKLREI